MRQEAIMDTARSTSITPSELTTKLGVFPPPALVDVRTPEALGHLPETIAAAPRRDLGAIGSWGRDLEPWRSVVVYCAHGHERSQGAARALNALGLDAHYLAGGIDGWRAEGGATAPMLPPTRWVTRERPKIDRIACPWLIRRFLDPSAELFYVPNSEVRAFALAQAAEPYDVPDVAYSHAGDRCSFDAFIRIHALEDQALGDLALIVRGADTADLGLAPQAAGLVATSLGLSRLFSDDLTMLKWGMLVYDSLYAWCRQARGETHGWDPARLRIA
jgi:rhodanese-related sulfurtransferase